MLSPSLLAVHRGIAQQRVMAHVEVDAKALAREVVVVDVLVVEEVVQVVVPVPAREGVLVVALVAVLVVVLVIAQVIVAVLALVAAQVAAQVAVLQVVLVVQAAVLIPVSMAANGALLKLRIWKNISNEKGKFTGRTAVKTTVF